MKPTRPILACFLAAFMSAPLLAQEDLTQDAAFFKNQKNLYQRWLDQSGLGQVLRVYEIEVKSDQVSIYLALPFENPDSCFAAWQQLKKDFSSKNPGNTLEKQLFYKAAHMLELRRSLVVVQLFDTYNIKKDPCFIRAIHSSGESVKVDSTGCKSEVRTVRIDPTDLKNTKTAKQDFSGRMRQDVVFEKIHQVAKARYERQKPGCDGRHPSVDPPFIDANIMKLEVNDLCKEVLTDETNHTVCEWLKLFGKPCNWIARERLVLTFTYIQRGQGYELRCEIEGKVGSGYYDQVKRGGYLDMEVEFDEELKHYAEGFQRELKSVLTN